MSESDDTRVLNMRINNKDFLKGASDSLQAIDTLNKGIDSAGKGKGMQALSGSVDKVKGHFSAMEVVGVTALATITSKAVSAGLSMIKSLTIGPILDGWKEYNTLLTSTQTIMANTGASANEAGRALDSLNHYSDLTVYSFGQMAENIGKFTAAGVGIDDAVSSIKGLANSAALAGSSNEQLGTAMYQMSQALSQGTIKLMDWNSLANAGMGGKNMRESLMATAHSMGKYGVAMDAAIKKHGNFRESLSEGWLKAEVFNKSMKVMAGQTLDASSKLKDFTKLGLDKSTQAMFKAGKQVTFTSKQLKSLADRGFNKTQISALAAGNTIAYTAKQLQKMGYAKEAAKQLSGLSQRAIDSATKIKTFSQLIDVVKESIGSGWSSVFKELFGNLSEARDMWTAVGNVVTGAVSKIFKGVIGLLDVWHNMKDAQTGMNGFQLFWASIGNIFKSIGNLLHPFVILIQSILPASDDAGSGLFSLTKGFYNFSVWLEKVTSGTSYLTPIFQGLGWAIKFVFGIIGAYIKSMFDLIMLFKPVGVALGGLAQALGGLADRLLGMIGITANFGDAFKSFENIRAAILMPFINTLAHVINLLTALANGDISFSTFEALVKRQFINLGNDIINGITVGLSNFGAIKSAIGNMVSNMVDFFKGLLGIHSPSTVFAEFGKNIVEGLANGLLGALSLIGKAIKALGDKLLNADEFDVANLISIIFGGAVFITVTKFIHNLLNSFNDIHNLFKNFNGLLNQTTSTMKSVQTGIRAKALLNIAIAIGILAASLWVLSKIPYDRLAVGLPVIVLLLRQMSAVMTSMAKDAATTKTAVASMVAMSLAMGLMAGAILILSAAVFAFGSMKTSTLVKGMVAVGIVMYALTVASESLGKAAPTMILAAAGLLILSVALTAMAGVILLFDKINPKTLASGLLKMGVTLVVLAAAMSTFANFAPQMLVASIALVVLSAALTGLAGVIAIFSKISFGTVVGSVAKMAIAIVALGLAGEVAAPGLIVLGIAAAAIGAGLFLAGTGVALLGAGLTVLAAAGVASAAVLAAAFESFLSLLPLMAIQIVAALDAFLAALAKKMPSIVESLVKIGAAVLKGLGQLTGKIVDLAVKIIEQLIDGLVKVAPELGAAATKIIEGLLEGLDKNASGMIDKGVDLVIDLIQGLGQAEADIITAAAQTLLSFLTALDAAITTYEPQIIAMGIKIAFDLITGLVQGLVPQPILDAFNSFVQTILNFFKGLLGINSPSTVFAGFGRNIVEGLANGVTGAIHLVTGVITNLVGGAIDIVQGLPGKARAALSGLGGILKSVFGGAFKTATSAVGNGVSAIGSAINKIPGLIRGALGAVGNAAKSVGSAIVTGIKHGLSGAVGAVGDLGGSLLKALKSTINSALHLPFNIPKLTLKIGPKHFSIGGQQLIPRFAKGVTGFGGGSALVGEVGPEVVTMGRGSNVITNEKLVGFMKQVAALTRLLARGSTSQNSPGGTIQYVVSADFKGDPKASGVAFAANIAAGLVTGLKANQSAVDSSVADMGTQMSQAFADILGIQSPSTVFHKYAGFVGQGFCSRREEGGNSNGHRRYSCNCPNHHRRSAEA
jgi:tape measure domain-containing protein